MKKALPLLFAISSAAFAEQPKYDCYVETAENVRREFSLIINEKEKTVTHISNNKAELKDAQITPDIIEYKSRIYNEHIEMYFQYEISRDNLNVVETFFIAPRTPINHPNITMPPEKTFHKGKCQTSISITQTAHL